MAPKPSLLTKILFIILTLFVERVHNTERTEIQEAPLNPSCDIGNLNKNMSQVVYDVVVVGGGLSGIIVARNIQAAGKSWKLLEARSKLGGRLENDPADQQIDLGGAWIWPRHQRQIVELIQSFDEKNNIELMQQPDDSSSVRIVGGAIKIVETIATQLPSERIQLNSPVVSCTRKNSMQCSAAAGSDDGSSVIHLELESGETVYGNRVVFAVPPKILSMHTKFDPPLSPKKMKALSSSQTWMAGVTKVALVYNSPRFWSLQESNGGFRPGWNQPAFQVYDSSPFSDDSNNNNAVSALTFFALASLSKSKNSKKKDEEDDLLLARQCADQFVTSLSSTTLRKYPNIQQKLKEFDSFHIKRWPDEKYISEDANPMGINPHPMPNADLGRSEWDGLLLFAGTETDRGSPGVMEGAVGSALRVTAELEQLWY